MYLDFPSPLFSYRLEIKGNRHFKDKQYTVNPKETRKVDLSEFGLRALRRTQQSPLSFVIVLTPCR